MRNRDTAIDPDLPCLLADIGATHARFAQRRPGHDALHQHRVLPMAELASLDAALQRYREQSGEPLPRQLVLAIAAPVSGDGVAMTNSGWRFSIDALQQRWGFRALRVCNDLCAQVLALASTDPQQFHPLGGAGQRRCGQPLVLLGVGSGLGVGVALPSARGWLALPSEGGHSDFAPADELERELLALLWQRYPHLSCERLLSGPGLVLLHQALQLHAGRAVEAITPHQLGARALAQAGEERETVLRFGAMLGSVAGNLALTLGAGGGLYLGGGIVEKLYPLLQASGFRQRFEDKGRYREYLQQIPTRALLDPDSGLKGAALLAQGSGALVGEAAQGGPTTQE
ncbi:glucokinase [Aestuariirhabdus litorea]|uniref:Glucokinase n=1 Tax=Aestuariirhabdus litorea TaxID=2528527 RepID=A0A3P3VMH5_9GAMM|nr:glucokinase [Aestuariirhabdus litorea]RRJ83972.1 glucokinase [Aestuariirhabdus litorea]RWW97192.1 glucokinase [Endozoicomonadaceae bacterium GTF-13]